MLCVHSLSTYDILLSYVYIPVLWTTCNRCILYYWRTAVDRGYRAEPADDTATATATVIYYYLKRCNAYYVQCAIPSLLLFYFCPCDI